MLFFKKCRTQAGLDSGPQLEFLWLQSTLQFSDIETFSKFATELDIIVGIAQKVLKEPSCPFAFCPLVILESHFGLVTHIIFEL